MNRTYAHNTAGLSAVAARVRVQAAARGIQGLGFGWSSVVAPGAMSHADLSFMATTGNKRPPRRLGQRTT